MSARSYDYRLIVIDEKLKSLIYKDIYIDKTRTRNKYWKYPLFTFLHSANFNNTRTAALQDVTVKDNNIATDCFKEDC